MKDSSYDQLEQLVNAYFHQDWPDEYEDEASVLAGFVSGNWSDDVQRTIAQIDHYLAAHPDGLSKAFVADFNPMIVIGANDAEAEQWLVWVRDYLVQHLSSAPLRK